MAPDPAIEGRPAWQPQPVAWREMPRSRKLLVIILFAVMLGLLTLRLTVTTCHESTTMLPVLALVAVIAAFAERARPTTRS